MTARESTTVLVDAATVYAEGVLAGLRTASAIVNRTDDAFAPNLALAQAIVDRRVSGPDDLATLAALLAQLKQTAPPLKLQAQVREWRAHVYYNQWLAEQARPAPVPRFPDRKALLARIHAFLLTFPDTDHD